MDDEPLPPEPPPDRNAGPCLYCSDPGDAGQDMMGNRYCQRHETERQQRLAAAYRAIGGAR